MISPRLFALSVGLLTASASALPTADLTRSGGVLGQTVSYGLQGDPSELFGLALSTNTGPTPLAIFDPSDPRVLEVGINLLSLWQVGVLNPAGQANLAFPIPSQPALQGVPLHAQMVTLPGTMTLVDEISERCSFVLGQSQGSTYTAFNNIVEINGHQATSLDDGSVLLSGGAIITGAGTALATNKVYRFDNQSGEFSEESYVMGATRVQHTATKLADGRVLTLGGANDALAPFASGEILDPVAGSSTSIPNMSTPRVGHTATLLNDGRVFVAGGADNFDLSDPLGALSAVLSSTEIYNPTTNSWSSGPSLPKPRVLHSASLTGNGQVLVTGGIEITTILFVSLPDFSNSASRYNPSTGSILSTPSFSTARALHGQVTLSNGDVLVAGGVEGDILLQTFSPLASARLYDTSANTWTSVANMSVSRVLPSLFDTGGTVVAMGGLKTFDLVAFTGAPADEIEATTTSVLSWNTTATMQLPRFLAVSALFDGGQRILTSGSGDNGSSGTVPDLTAEIYIP